VETPFDVELARKRKTMGYTPTLIPVASGGARVNAETLVIRGDIAPDLVADMLWRIETRQSGRQRYPRPDVIGLNDDVVVEKGPRPRGNPERVVYQDRAKHRPALGDDAG
jgi:hypothetical protein